MNNAISIEIASAPQVYMFSTLLMKIPHAPSSHHASSL